jgi:hypothetical protein
MTESNLFLHVWLYVCIFGLLLLAVLYLRRREMSTLAYVLWGVFALVVPVVGPFVVIASRPGKPPSRELRI